MAIEDRIQEQRKMKGLSQEQFADVLGVSRQAVSKWESGQSLPEIEKLIAMCDLFGVSIDYILRGEMPQASARNNGIRLNERLSSLIVNTVAVMLFAVALFATMGQLRNDPGSGDIYGGLIIESTGVMILLVGWFLAGGRTYSKPLFTISILLAGMLPASFLAQVVLGYAPNPLPPFQPLPMLLFGLAYIVICGIVLFFALRSKGFKSSLS